jgi:type VII secretion integral membrane protein EccD
VSELRNVKVASAAPDTIRVSVLGGRTQLDVALPVDVPIAAFLPELAHLIGSRDRRDEELTGRDERRTFWVLSRADGDTELAPEHSLRHAGVSDGELLRISQRRALSPPTLFDDVVDAAARLNRASYAAWDATAATVMSLAGLWVATAAWMYLLVTEALSAHRVVVVGCAVLTVVTTVGGAALARRALGRTDIATAAGLPAIALSAALGWTLTETHSGYVRAAACAVLLVLTALYYRLIGTGHWAYLATAVVFAFTAVALLGNAFGVRTDVLAIAAATVATLAALAVSPLTARLGHSPAPIVEPASRDPLTPANLTDTDAGETMPSAEEVWARVHAAALTRAGLLAGLAFVVVTAAALLLHTVSFWPAFVFALNCAAVLALQSRKVRTVPERASLALPATALVLIACGQVQSASDSLRLAGVVVLVAAAVVAIVSGLIVAGGRVPRWTPAVSAYLEYVVVAALVPLALWPLGIYGRLGW